MQEATPESMAGEGKIMKQKLIVSQALMWAAAILVVALVDEKASAVPILVVLATISLGSLSKSHRTSA